MDRKTLVTTLQTQDSKFVKAVVVGTLIIAVLLLAAYFFNWIILLRLCLATIALPAIGYLWRRFAPAILLSPGRYMSSSSAKLLTQDKSPVKWMYLLQVTQTQYSSTVGVEKDLVLGLKNKRLIKINYNTKQYNLNEDIKFDIDGLMKFVETELLDKDGRIGHSAENAKWFTDSKFN